MSDIPNNKKELYKQKNEIKYCSLVAFGNQVGQILDDCQYIVEQHRQQPVEDLSGLQRLALSILLMNNCNFRVGMMKHNKKSTGLLTIETNQYSPDMNTIAFLGKKRVLNQCYLGDSQLNREIYQLWREVDGYPVAPNGKKYLFRFDGGAHRVSAEDLNSFLQIYNRDFSAKMFRTWKANLILLEELNELPIPYSQKEIANNLRDAIEATASQLYHTTHICRRSYLDGRIIELYRKEPSHFHNQTVPANQRLVRFFESFC